MSVVSFGELLIDFVALEHGVSVGEASGFKKAPVPVSRKRPVVPPPMLPWRYGAWVIRLLFWVRWGMIPSVGI